MSDNNKNKNYLPIFLFLFILLAISIFSTSGIYALELNEANITEYGINLENSRDIKEISPAGDKYSDIQNAINQANNGDVIVLDKEIYHSQGEPIHINKAVNIKGDSPNGIVTLDSNFLSNAIIIDETASGITISNCKIINGDSWNGGAIIVNAPNVVVENCVFENNNAHSGGAIMIFSSDVTINDCIFENNNARGGGAVNVGYEVDINPNYGRNLLIQNCNFINNFATHAAGALGSYGNNSRIVNCNFISNKVYNSAGDSNVFGGAVQIGRDGFNIASEILNCKFIGNSADAASTVYKSHGGAGCVREGISYKGCTFINNSADEGGALTFHASANIYDCIFINNTATNMGGAISTGWVDMNMNVLFSDCEFEKNNAPFGGAIQMNGENINLLNSNFTDNYASQSGGAIHIRASSTNLDSNIFRNNIANVNGGAIYIQGEESIIENNEFIANEAIPNPKFYNDGLGGAIYINGTSNEIRSNQFKFNTARNGSAIYFDKDGDRCVINNNIMYNNQAWVYSLPIFVKNHQYYGELTTIESVIYGGNNIGDIDDLSVSNAVYNNAEYSKIEINDVIPVDGARDTGELYQDTREYGIDILLTVIHEDGTVVYNNTLKSDVWGKVSINLENLKPGLYKVLSTHFEDTYYKTIANTTEFRVYPKADVQTMKNSDAEEFNYHDFVVWTVNIKNNGPNDATGVKVTDVLPEGLVWIEDNSNGAYNPNNGIWNIGSLSNGSATSIEIICLINKTGFFINKANVSANEYDFNLNNNLDLAEIYVNPAADVSIIKTVNNTNPNYGDKIKWILKITNIGPDKATNVVVEDVLPEGLVYLSSSDNFNGKWEVGTLNIGESKVLEIVCFVNGTGDFLNVASVGGSEYDPNLENNEDDESIVVPPASDLAIEKTVNNTNPKYQETVKWSIKVTNNGPNTANNVIIRDIIPEGLNVVSTSDDFVNNVWSVGTLNFGESRVLEIVCFVNGTGDFLNVASVGGSEYDPNLENNEDDESIVVPPASDLAIEKTVNNTNPKYQETVKWSIKVTNYGPNSATNVNVQDLIPNGLIFMRYSSSLGNYNSQTGIWTIDSLTRGYSAYLDIYCRVNKTGDINNIVNVGADEYDPNKDNNKDEEEIRINKTVDLSISKSVDNPLPDYLETITWNIIVSNNGPDVATGVTVMDLLPQGLVFLSSDGDFSDNIWYVGELEAGQSRELNILCFVNRTGEFENIVQVTGNEEDSDLTNNEDKESISVREAADLAVEKTVSKFEYAMGDVVEYQIKVSNRGPDTAYNLVLSEYLDENLELMEYSSSNGEFSSNGSYWKLDSMGNGQSSYLTIKARAVDEGMANNKVVISSDTYDYDLSNNNDSALIKIEKPAKILENLSFTNKSAVKSTNSNLAVALSEMEKTGMPIMLVIFVILLSVPVISIQFYKKK